MLRVGDKIEVIPRTELSTQKWSADSTCIHQPWVLYLNARDGAAPGIPINAWVLEINHSKEIVTVTNSNFGFSPISDRMRPRYVCALRDLMILIGETRSELGVKAADCLSEVKGMYSRCWRRDQWDWCAVWIALGRPSYANARNCSQALGEAAKRLRANSADADAMLIVRQTIDIGTIAGAFESISAQTPGLPSGRLIQLADRTRKEARTQPQIVMSSYSKDKLEHANLTHSSLLVSLTSFLSSHGHKVEANQHVDAFVRLRSGPAIFELKSLTDGNEMSQLRKGVSQLYEYRFRHSLSDASLWLVFSRKLSAEWMLDYLELDRDIRVIWMEGNGFVGRTIERLLESGSRARDRQRTE